MWSCGMEGFALLLYYVYPAVPGQNNVIWTIWVLALYCWIRCSHQAFVLWSVPDLAFCAIFALAAYRKGSLSSWGVFVVADLISYTKYIFQCAECCTNKSGMEIIIMLIKNKNF